MDDTIPKPSYFWRICLFVLLLPVLLLLAPILIATIYIKHKSFRRVTGKQSYKVPHEAPVELYHFPFSLCASKVRQCLLEKGVEHRLIEIDIGHFGKFGHLTRSFKAINPNACVPVLVHDGYPILESHEIMAYIDAAFAGPSLGTSIDDALVQSRVKRWSDTGEMIDAEMPNPDRVGSAVALMSGPMAELDYSHVTLRSLAFAFFRHPQPARVLIKAGIWFFGAVPISKSITEDAFKVIGDCFDEMERELADGAPFLAGDSLSVADIAWASNLHRLFVVGVLDDFLKSRPALREYWMRMQSRDSFQKVYVEPLHDDRMHTMRQIIRRQKEVCAKVGARAAYGLV